MRFTLALATLASTILFAAEPELHNVRPAEGYVPDEATAIKIAVAVWEPIYGAAQVAKQKPYRARLHNGVWTVEGTLHTELGGVALVEIAKVDGRILRVSHGK